MFRAVSTGLYLIWGFCGFSEILSSENRSVDDAISFSLSLWTLKWRKHLCSCAFDSVSPSNLIHKLKCVGMRDTVCEWIFIFHLETSQGQNWWVCVWWTCFNYWLVTRLKLRPLLFSLYVWQHYPLLEQSNQVQMVSKLPFLGVTITNYLSWHLNISIIV